MGLLQEKALACTSAVREGQSAIRQSYKIFVGKLWKVFYHPVQGKEAAKRLMALRQGSHSVAEYSVDFKTLAAEAGWDESALQSVFTNGHSEQLKDELALRDEFKDLDSLF